HGVIVEHGKLVGSDLTTARVLLDATAQRLRQELVAETHAKHGQPAHDHGSEVALSLEHPGLGLHHARGTARHDQARQRTRIRQGLASAAVRDEPRALPGASDALAQQVREIPTLLPCGRNRITGHQDAKRQHAPERSRLLWWQPRRQTCEDPARMSAFRPKRLSIATISAEPMSIELSEPFGIATGSQLCAANVLVRLGLSDGSCGLGEAAPFPAVSGETQQG